MRGCKLSHYRVGGDLLSHADAVSSALRGLTSLFGMGRGAPPRDSRHSCLGGPRGRGKPHGDRDPLRPRDRCHVRAGTCVPQDAAVPGGGWERAPASTARGHAQAIGQLVPLGSTCRHASTCGLSTWSSTTAL